MNKLSELVGDDNPKDGEGNPIPIEAYIHYLDGIAHNEDVKYHERPWRSGKGAYNVLDEATGRENNQLTLALYINIVLGRVTAVDTQQVIAASNKRNGKELKNLIQVGFSEAVINDLYVGLFD